MNFKNMSDVELAEFMVSLIKQVSLLREQLIDYLEGNDRTNNMADIIKKSYRQLKADFKGYYHYLSLRKNEYGSILYESCFYYSVRDAYIKGFSSAANSKIDNKMLASVSDALEELSYLLSLDEWDEIINKAGGYCDRT